MLVVVMHSNLDYLEALMQLAKKENIKDSIIIKRKNIGVRLIGGEANFIFTRGRMLDAYDKAFVAVVKGEDNAKHFLNLIEQDSYLDMLNLKDKGFICTVPLHCIEDLKSESVSIKKKG
jgi:hypothetical protein